MTTAKRSIAGKYVEDLLIGTVESIVRAGAKAIESITNDAARAIDREKRKVEQVKVTVETFRKTRLGEVDDDIEEGNR
jgi:hypothetical protein